MNEDLQLQIGAELEGAAAILYALCDPMIEGDNRQTVELIGLAMHGVAMFLDRINEDIGNL